ncbi:MAG: AMP-binding protein, partial [Pseudomonadota bacterium]
MPSDASRPAEKFAPVRVLVTQDGTGATTLQNALPLEQPPLTLLSVLKAQAERSPDAIFLSERSNDGWTGLSYAEFRSAVVERAGRLMALGLSTRPLLILAPNSIDHAVTAFAAMAIGAPASV